MTGPRRRPMNEDERRVRDALRGLPPAAPDPEFEGRMLREFVAAATPGDSARPRRRIERRRRPAGTWWALAAGMAAALVLGVLLWREAPAPTWSIETAAAGPGVVTIDGVTRSTDEWAAHPEALVAGAEVHTDGGTEWTLRLGETWVWVFTPGTRATLADFSTGGSTARVQLTAGELRISTGPDFRGRQLLVASEEAEVQVVGTTLAVIRNDAGTCVCVFEGAVEMRPRGAPAGRVVPAGERRVLFRDPAQEPHQEPLQPMERGKLDMLREQAAAWFRGAP